MAKIKIGMGKYATGIRFLRGFNIDKNQEINRVDILLVKILKEGPQEISGTPENQFHFSFSPDSITPKKIACCLRSLAYKISKIGGKHG